ncbi:MAG TPA: CpaD family pilus assembly protein [Caulobacteraceae bacterium]|nr:CpaD family pilus assembly protein [Caulobacteraceae bacterium]
MIRRLFVPCLAVLTCACASQQADLMHFARKDPKQPVTPSEQFSITVTQGRDEILLAPHPDGLSDAQMHALAQLVDRWRNASGSTITIRTPASGEEAMYRATTAVQTALEAIGVRPEQIQLTSYDAGPGAPIGVSFLGYQAHGPQCGRNWNDFTQTGDNEVSKNFGCAVTANVAAMIANPVDLLAPRPMDSSDAGRRETIIGKYHLGVIGSTPKDAQADGAISGAIN